MLYFFNARGSRISIITFPCVTWHTTHDTWHMAHSRVLPINCWFLQIQNNLLTKCLQCHPLHWSLIPLVPPFNWSPIQLVPISTGLPFNWSPMQLVQPIYLVPPFNRSDQFGPQFNWSSIQLVLPFNWSSHSTGPPIQLVSYSNSPQFRWPPNQLVLPFNWSPNSTGLLFNRSPIQLASQSTGPQFNWSSIQLVPNASGLTVKWSSHSTGAQFKCLPFNWSHHSISPQIQDKLSERSGVLWTPFFLLELTIFPN